MQETLVGHDGLPWPQTFDARLWAQMFIEKISADPTRAADIGDMTGWFANAIMCGYDHAIQELEDAAAQRASRPIGAHT